MKRTYKENGNRKVYNIDFDGTLTDGKYTSDPEPNLAVIEKVIDLYFSGHLIIIWSARLWNDAQWMAAWLIKHAVPFHGVMLGKGGTDYYIDDKAVHVDDFLKDQEPDFCPHCKTELNDDHHGVWCKQCAYKEKLT